MSKMNPKAPVPVQSRQNFHSFSQVPTADIQRSKFDFSSIYKVAFDPGYLIPVYADEVLPGDTWSMSTAMLIRFATLQAPIMDDIYLDLHWWFVPNRLIWEHWANFMGEQLPNPGSSTAYTVPTVSFTPATTNGYINTIFDYLGYPISPLNLHEPVTVDALELRSYNLIYNTWYRDQNLIDSVPQDFNDGPDTATDYVLLRRGKRHDYFTSCLPWPQKGDAVTIPLVGTAPVTGTFDGPEVAVAVPVFGTGADSTPQIVSATSTGSPFPVTLTAAGTTGQLYPQVAANTMILNTSTGGTGLTADLSAVTVFTINALRQSISVQQLLERDARGGTRLTEIIHSHFGVISPDARMQRPEFLGSSSGTVGIYSVPQTTPPSGGSTAPGYLTAFGISTPPSGHFTHSFTEHGIIMGILSARARYTYTQGLRRGLSRQTRYDYYWPTFAMLGEQAVLNQEICFAGAASDTEVFGYQERWAEYRYRPSMAVSYFRTNVTDALLQWELAQNFATVPTLAQTFIEENPPTDQVVAVTEADGPTFKGDINFTTFVTRPLPVYSVPGLLRL